MPQEFAKNLPKSAFEKILKENGAIRVSDNASELFRKLTEDKIKEVTLKAWKYAQHANRKTILASDIALAIKEYGNR